MKYIPKFELIFCILTVFLFMGSIRFLDDNDYAQDEIILHANIRNLHESSISNVKLKYLVLDGPGIFRSTSASDLGSRDTAAKRLQANTRGMVPGEYYVRIYAYGEDGEKRIKHRPIIIE